MILLQTLVLPEAVPPATPIRKGDEEGVAAAGTGPAGLGAGERKAEPFSLVGDCGGVKGGGGESSRLILHNIGSNISISAHLFKKRY